MNYDDLKRNISDCSTLFSNFCSAKTLINNKSSSMYSFSLLNGILQRAEVTHLPVTDLSILRGYAIFDYFRIQNGAALFLEDYLDRFLRSAHGLRLQFQWSKNELMEMVSTLMEANQQSHGGIRMLMTGGNSSSGYAIEKANLIMISYPPVQYPAWFFERGVKAMTVRHQRELPHIKSINYLSGLYYRNELESRSAQFLLYHDGSFFRESDRYNIFFVDHGNKLITPEKAVLHGVTRKQILELATKHDIPYECREVELTELKNFKEAFFTSTTLGAVPVIQIDDFVIGDGMPGTVYQRIKSLFDEHCLEYVSKI